MDVEQAAARSDFPCGGSLSHLRFRSSPSTEPELLLVPGDYVPFDSGSVSGLISGRSGCAYTISPAKAAVSVVVSLPFVAVSNGAVLVAVQQTSLQ